MIKSFRDKDTLLFFHKKNSKKLPPHIIRTAYRKLRMIEYAECLEDLRIPFSNHLEKLVGKRKGQHSIRINKQWRICFIWRDDSAYEVEITNHYQ